MFIFIDENVHSEEDIENLLNNNQIEYTSFDNPYIAVCREEIGQAIDCSDVITGDSSFYDIAQDEAEQIVWKLSRDLCNSGEAENAFQDLAVTAQLIADREINKMIGGDE